MRALIVLGGEAPKPELLRACAKNADLTIAADSGLAAFAASGVVPDLLIGDMDSVDPALLGRFGDVPQERLCCVKDDTDGVHAVDVALARPNALSLILLDGVEKLSDENREALYARCREKGVQFIATRTTNDSELEVHYL